MNDNQSQFNAVVIGGFVAALVIGAFVLGYSGVFQSDGPAEQVGEKIDKAAESMKQGLKDMKQGIDSAGKQSGQ